MSKDKSTGGFKLTCRNWECGVIIPVPESQPVDKTTLPTSADDDMSCLRGRFLCLCKFPGLCTSQVTSPGYIWELEGCIERFERVPLYISHAAFAPDAPKRGQKLKITRGVYTRCYFFFLIDGQREREIPGPKKTTCRQGQGTAQHG